MSRVLEFMKNGMDRASFPVSKMKATKQVLQHPVVGVGGQKEWRPFREAAEVDPSLGTCNHFQESDQMKNLESTRAKWQKSQK